MTSFLLMKAFWNLYSCLVNLEPNQVVRLWIELFTLGMTSKHIQAGNTEKNQQTHPCFGTHTHTHTSSKSVK